MEPDSSPAASLPVLWPRCEVFEYVRKYRHIHEINSKYFTVINSLNLDSATRAFSQTFAYPEWETVGSEDLQLYEAYIKCSFDHFCSLREIRIGHRKRATIENQTVNFYEFVLFLFVQFSGRASYAATAARGALWPAHLSSPAAASLGSPGSPTRSTSASSIQSPIHSPKRRSPYKRVTKDQPLLISQLAGFLSPHRTPARVPPLQLNTIRSSSGKRDVDRFDLGLEEQKQFILDNIDGILLLLSAGDSNGHIAAHELDALGFLLSVGPDVFSRIDAPLSDAVPDTIERFTKQDPQSPSLTTTMYSRDDIANWICESLVINTYLYSPQHHHTSASPMTSNGSRGAAIVPMEEPLCVYRASNMTLFKTDKASLPDDSSNGPMLSARERKDSVSSAGPISPTSSSGSVPTSVPALTPHPSSNALQPMSTSASTSSMTNISPNISSLALSGLRSSGYTKLDTPLAPEALSQDTRIVDCSHCYIYLLKPLGHVRIDSCRDTTILLGAVGGILDVRRCRNVQIIAACHSIQINNCQDSAFYLLTNSRPLLLGVNHHLQFGPFNTHYRSVGRHLREAHISATVNHWAEPLLLAVERSQSTHSAASSPARSLSLGAEPLPFSIIRPEAFLPFRVPFDLVGDTKSNPYELTAEYRSALEEAATEAIEIKQAIERRKFDKSMRERIRTVLGAHFENWLRQTGNYQQLEDLIRLQVQ